MSRLEQLKSSLAKGSISSISTYDIRNKDKRVRDAGFFLKRLKKDTNKKSKLLFLTETAFPFNPFTGEALEGINEYRITSSSTNVILSIKEAVNENADLKNKYMKLAGVTEWDTSDIETVTVEDIKVLRFFRDELIFTQEVMSINDKVFTGKNFPIDYLVDYKTDPITGAVIGDTPVIVEAHRLMLGMYFEAVGKLMEEEEAKPESEKSTEKSLKATKSGMRKRIITISDKHPKNTAIAIEIPLKSNLKIDLEKFNPELITSENIMKHLVLVKVNDKLGAAMENYNNGTNELIDTNVEFIELDMKCTKDTEPMDLGKNTPFDVPLMKINTYDWFEGLNKAIIEFRESDAYQEIEKLFLRSARTLKFTPELGKALVKRLGSLIEPDNENLSANVMQNNQHILQMIFGSEFNDMLMDAEMGLIPEGSKVSDEEVKETKEEMTSGLDIANVIGGRKVDIGKLDEIPL